MTPTTYAEWDADGRPWHAAPVIAAFADLMSRHGFTVYAMGDESHLRANPPEDHTPFSHTPWPMSHPYPFILALDIMPGGAVDWRKLGAQIVADKGNGVPGAAWIKYVNWTGPSGNCSHTSWEPDYAQRGSSDTGHIHISARSDRWSSSDLKGWDPVAHLLGGGGGTPSPTPHPGGWDMSQFTNLTRGSKGYEVRGLQGLLNAQGARDEAGNMLTVDGDFGQHTDAAVRSFQRSITGLAVDGQAGPHTRCCLNTGHDL